MPRWKDLKRYCENTNYILYKSTDHDYYEKYLENGDVLRTKVSRGSKEIPKHLFNFILKHQLKTTKEEFNKNI